MKPIQLTQKEIRRASGGLTVVVRPQAKQGLYMVAVVRLASRLPIFRPSFVERAAVSKEIQEDLRMADKCGWNCPMASATRHRNF